VISYNFDHATYTNTVTRNIFIGWENEPVKKVIQKPKSAVNHIGLDEKTWMRNRMMVMNKMVSKAEEKKNNQNKILVRLNST
jgi:hypothetical protein